MEPLAGGRCYACRFTERAAVVVVVVPRASSLPKASDQRQHDRNQNGHPEPLPFSLRIELGFLFQRDNQYYKGLAALMVTDPALANYLRESRKWLHPLRLFRDELEHGNPALPMIMPERTADGKIDAKEPLVLGLKLTAFVRFIENRLNRFVEELWYGSCNARRLHRWLLRRFR